MSDILLNNAENVTGLLLSVGDENVTQPRVRLRSLELGYAARR